MRKVKSVRGIDFAVYLGRNTRNSIDSEKHGVEMELHPAGVHVVGEVDGKPHDMIVPYSNCGEIQLFPEAKELEPNDDGEDDEDVGTPDGDSEEAPAPESAAPPPQVKPAKPRKPRKS